MWVKVTLGKTRSHLDLKLPTWGLEVQVGGEEKKSRWKTDHNTSHNTRRYILIFVSTVWTTLANFGVVFSQICWKEELTNRRCCWRTSGSSHYGRSWHRRGTHPKRTQPGGGLVVDNKIEPGESPIIYGKTWGGGLAIFTSIVWLISISSTSRSLAVLLLSHSIV